MIIELTVKNMAVIKFVSLTFGRGLHALTGETGAGKSILIDAISLLLGARASADFVRSGADKAEIEGVFSINPGHPLTELFDEMGIMMDDEGMIVIRREISIQGKSICRVNGQVVTLSMLKQIGPRLIQMHGQHEHQTLLSPDQHLHLLDQFGGAKVQKAKQAYRQVYDEYQGLLREKRNMQFDERETAQRIDLLTFQLEEINEAQLQPGEAEELEQLRNRLMYAEKLFESMEEAYQSIQGEERGLESVGRALSQLQMAAAYDESLREPLDNLHNVFAQLEDTARIIRDYRDRLEFDPERLTEVESRLNDIGKLKRKYGKDIEEILQYADHARQELEMLKNREVHLEQIEQKLEETASLLAERAFALSQVRKEAAAQLETRLKAELKDLLMEKTRFEVRFNTRPDERGIEIDETRVKPMENGTDEVEFYISTNPGEPLRPLARIASGGELSRLMLALKSIFADQDQVNTFIFDEIDTGISGRAAQTVAEKMARVAATAQVLCVTHLPQLASMADQHYLIEKETDENETITSVVELDEEGRVYELSRMLGGAEVTDMTLNHAREMIQMADKLKRNLS